MVNMMVLVVAMSVVVVSFFRNQEDNFQSENPLAALNRVMSAAKEAARNENEDEGAAIEMGEIYKGGRESSFENVNPMARSSSGWVEFVDESSGAKYLFNEKTGETKWE